MSPLLARIRQLLPPIVSQTSWDQAADEDRFEGYLFALVLQTAGKEGAIVRFENRNGPFTGIATFRTAPAGNAFWYFPASCQRPARRPHSFAKGAANRSARSAVQWR